MIKDFLDGHDQKWVWSVWSWHFKINSISRMKTWEKVMFACIGVYLGQLKFISMIFGWAWSKMGTTISLNPKICSILKISLWIELSFFACRLWWAMQQFLVRLTCYSISLTFKCQCTTFVPVGSPVVAGRVL